MKLAARPTMMFPLILLIMLALLTFWINQSVQTPAPKLDGSSRHDADYIVSHFVTTQTDILGNLRYKLAANEMKHFPDDDSTLLQLPRYTQFAVGKPYTQVEGRRGEMSNNGELVEIFDKVKVTRQAFAEKGEMTLETDYLNIRPNDEIVQTPNHVTIRQAPKTVIYATGMLYDKKKRTMTLLNKVRAHYEKPAKLRSVSANKRALQNTKPKAAIEKPAKTTNTVHSTVIPISTRIRRSDES